MYLTLRCHPVFAGPRFSGNAHPRRQRCCASVSPARLPRRPPAEIPTPCAPAPLLLLHPREHPRLIDQFTPTLEPGAPLHPERGGRSAPTSPPSSRRHRRRRAGAFTVFPERPGGGRGPTQVGHVPRADTDLITRRPTFHVRTLSTYRPLSTFHALTPSPSPDLQAPAATTPGGGTPGGGTLLILVAPKLAY